MRVRAREAALKLLFSRLFENPAEEEDRLNIYNELELDEKAEAFATRLYRHAIDNFDKYTKEIAALSKSYSIERMFAVDKCVIMLAISEMETEDVPAVVTINEAVNLVRRYSTENSVNFVNGILAAYNQKRGENE